MVTLFYYFLAFFSSLLGFGEYVSEYWFPGGGGKMITPILGLLSPDHIELLRCRKICFSL